MAVERDSGMLKRLAGTPMPKSSYFMGKVGMVFATAGVQIALLLALGVAFFGLDLPSTASRWWTFTWVIVLGITASTLLGIAVGGIVRDAKSAPAVTNLPFIALQFISGVFIAVNLLPLWVVRVSQLFPLHWICRGMRAAFLPDSFSTIETGGSWNLGVAAAVLGAWCIGGFVLCAKTFRWVRD